MVEGLLPGYWGSQCYGMGVPALLLTTSTRQHAPSSGSFNAQLGHLTLAALREGSTSGAPQSCWAWVNRGSSGQTLSSACVGLQSAPRC